MSRRWRSIFGFCAVLLVMDAIAAQLTDVMLDRLLPSEKEKEYRTSSPIYHHDLRPNVDSVAGWGSARYPVRSNALGFRSNSVGEVALKSSRPRLLFIGDSFTEGVGVPYEQTFAGRIASAYRERDVEVLNAGVRSYAPTIYYRKVRYLIEEVGLRFDTLAVFIDIPDIWEEAYIYDLDANGNVVAKAPWGRSMERRIREWLVRNSLIFRFGRAIKKSSGPVLAKVGQPGCWRSQERWDTKTGLYREYGETGLRHAAEAMDQLYLITQHRDTGLIIAIFPRPEQIAGRHLDSRQVTFWRAWTAERGVAFLNLFPAFITDEPPKEVIRRNFLVCDSHWNAAGHKRVADFFLTRFPGAEALRGAARFNSKD